MGVVAEGDMGKQDISQLMEGEEANLLLLQPPLLGADCRRENLMERWSLRTLSDNH